MIKQLEWSDGITGNTLPRVVKTLTLGELDFWQGRMRATCPYECGIIQNEIDLRDPRGSRGTLWEGIEKVQQHGSDGARGDAQSAGADTRLHP